MPNPPQALRAFVTVFGWTAGGAGFLLSLVLALTMLVRQGNPAFLLIWLAAFAATAACMRSHARWRRSVERMYAPQAVRPSYPARTAWRRTVEDVDFRDIPGAGMSFSHSQSR